ncbi:hypothetical protein D6C86_09326 [Aureobasidium pullulans]|uniref:Uncharacterized protein n=1 Tax=Aureobasidium pullulans TaxID=5580 RepID=A0A4S9PMT8_AURPU|nr:hypothetical protein D6C94_07206 [Aureobasidium pullulans]THZ45825.1 hypothetical protein D6C87_02611 [Aureobasidium pullulans]THZ54616.1 hypothetical protein D6C86_09326 [Aureobasidium pullulans]
MVLGPTARMWLPYLNFTVAISALGFQTAVLYPWHEELDKEFKVLKQEHRDQLHLHQQVTIKKLEDLEKRLLVTEKAIPDSAVRMPIGLMALPSSALPAQANSMPSQDQPMRSTLLLAAGKLY